MLELFPAQWLSSLAVHQNYTKMLLKSGPRSGQDSEEGSKIQRVTSSPGDV